MTHGDRIFLNRDENMVLLVSMADKFLNLKKNVTRAEADALLPVGEEAEVNEIFDEIFNKVFRDEDEAGFAPAGTADSENIGYALMKRADELDAMLQKDR